MLGSSVNRQVGCIPPVMSRSSRDGSQDDPWLHPRAPNAPPVLALGTMNFGKRTPTAEAERIVARAFERGIRLFDTANVYVEGESERILGRALRGKRDLCLVATKVGLNGIPKRREGLSGSVVEKALDESLVRLGTDYVDVYYLHAPDPLVPIEETLDALQRLVVAGKTRTWGVSNYASWQILEMFHLADARGMARPAISQVIYNVLIRQIEIEYVKFTGRYPLHTTIYNPLAGGLLAGKHQRGDAPPGSRFDNNRMYLRRYWTDRLFDHTAALGVIAREEGQSLIEFAYAWVAGRPGVDSILVGPADVSQLDAAIDGCAKSLGDAARKKVDELSYAFVGTDATYAR
jgi:aryl-alcohol dehydrogenase-like predicted oxidoreductase